MNITRIGYFYKTYLNSQAIEKIFSWIQNEFLHIYDKSLNDKLLVEELVYTTLVPFDLPSEEKMKRLYYLFSTIDNCAKNAFITILNTQYL